MDISPILNFLGIETTKSKLARALKKGNYQFYCEIFQDLDKSEIERLCILYKLDPSLSTKEKCDRLVQILKTKFIRLPNEIIDNIMLKSSGEDIRNWKDFEILSEKTYTRKKDSTLLEAIQNNNLEAVKYLIESGADIHANNEEALIASITYGRLDILKYIVESGEEIHVEKVLNASVSYGRLDILKYLVDSEILIKEDAVIPSIEYGQLEILKYLADSGVDILLDGEALRLSAEVGHINITKYLIESGVSIADALSYYVQWNRLEDVKTLLDMGIASNQDINNAFIDAVQMRDNDIDMVKLLLDYGADIHYRQDEALLISIGDEYLEMVKYLVEHGADIYARNSEALRLARENQYEDIVKYLESRV